MSDRAIKVLMTGLLIFGLALMLCWPIIVGHVPVHASVLVKRDYLVRFIVYISTLFVTFFCTIISAWVLIRRARAMILEDAQENLRLLMESTLRDHEKKRESPNA